MQVVLLLLLYSVVKMCLALWYVHSDAPSLKEDVGDTGGVGQSQMNP